jgi:hypothetical protein
MAAAPALDVSELIRCENSFIIKFLQLFYLNPYC